MNLSSPRRTASCCRPVLESKEYCLTVQGRPPDPAAGGPGLVAAPALQEDDLEQLAGLARSLEGYYACPQVVEWAQDREGRLLHHSIPPPASTTGPPKLAGCRAEEPVAGARGAAGRRPHRFPRGGGRPGISSARRRPASPRCPKGAVLVAPRTTPQLAPVLPRVAAIVTAVGSATGHLALVARDYGVPTLVDAPRPARSCPKAGGDRGRRPGPGLSGPAGGVAVPQVAPGAPRCRAPVLEKLPGGPWTSSPP